MPLFSRPDGTLITKKDEAPVRLFMPFIMRGRNNCVVYHEETAELSKARAWLKAFNEGRSREARATLFHLYLWGCGQVLHQRPQMNRFVSGYRLYQRKKAEISFSAKQAFRDDAPIVTVKLEAIENEPFTEFLERLRESLGESRSDRQSQVDKELALFTSLPVLVMRGIMAAARWLDRNNLFPASMIDPDPMFASLFVANLGSIGLNDTFHHLYEWGNISLFAAMGAPKKVVVAGRDGSAKVEEHLQVRWSFDERITDGFYCARSLRIMRRIIENPEPFVGPPTAD